jgi:hypothetical protein
VFQNYEFYEGANDNHASWTWIISVRLVSQWHLWY